MEDEWGSREANGIVWKVGRVLSKKIFISKLVPPQKLQAGRRQHYEPTAPCTPLHPLLWPLAHGVGTYRGPGWDPAGCAAAQDGNEGCKMIPSGICSFC